MSTTTSIYGFEKPTPGGDPGVWDTMLNGSLDDVDSEIARPRIPHSAPVVGATTTCDLSVARYFRFTVSEVTTLAFSNVPTSSFAVRILLEITNGAAFALTFPASVTWLRGGAPTLQAAGVDFVCLVTRDGGTTWYAEHAGPTLNVTTVAATNLGGTLSTAAQPNVTSVGLLTSKVGGSSVSNRVAHCLRTVGNLTTTNTAAVDVTSYSLAANTLDREGAGIRITVSGTFGATAGGLFRVLFGAGVVLSLTDGTGSANFFATIVIHRRAAGSQRSSAFGIIATATELDNASPAEDETGAIVIHFESDQAGAGTFTLRSVTIETLDPDSGTWG